MNTATGLEYLLSQMRADPPTQMCNSAGIHAMHALPTHRLPAGTRVLVQQLVAKPEYNGQLCARVLSFDARTGRYGAALVDGKELSLKPECVAKAGCATPGCASEEASSVCGRCQVVRYCSRECQRVDWKAHKPACVAGAHTHELTVSDSPSYLAWHGTIDPQFFGGARGHVPCAF